MYSKGIYNKLIKRFLDIVLSIIGIIVTSWLLIIIALLVKLSSKGSALFKQKRIGLNKKEFYILKFRTMRIDTPKDMPTHLLNKPEMYITPTGKFIRKTSLDELPQLFNILRGEMSIVGPRPALWNQYDLIAERDKYDANSVRPGLTGWAQINGRDELPIHVKARYDGEYIKRISLRFDIKIFFGTIISVVKSSGVREGRAGKNDNVQANIGYREE